MSTLADESDGDYSAGDLSLREAIYLAGQNAGHDLITFNSSLSGTIDLSIDDLEIDSDLTIEGPGASTITIDANGASGSRRRVFDVDSDVTVIISGLTLTGGYAFYGGALKSGIDSDVTLIDVTITGSHASNSGGGIYTFAAESLVLQDCTITGNSAEIYGGGITASTDRVYVYGSTISSNTTGYAGAGMAAFYKTLEMVDSTVSDNAFTDEGYNTRYGAGLHLADGILVRISGSTIEGNKSGGAEEDNATHGGGISAVSDGTEFTITDSVIETNESDSYGGGLYVTDGTIQLIRTTIEGNDSDYGGGFYSSSATVTMSDSLLADNDADSFGGGMMIGTDTEIGLTGVTVSGNSTSGSGGGLYFYNAGGSPSRMINCTVTDNSAGYAGGVYVTGTDLRLDNTIVADNSASSSYPDLSGTIDSDSSNNLIGDGTGLTGIADDDRGNQVGTAVSPIDPLLGTLAHNSGPTKTHMPQSTSPALDAGTESGASFQLAISYYDARGEGFSRTIGTSIDIGAVEYNAHELVVDELSNPANGTTLSEAITTANTRPGHDVISFSSGLDLSAAIDITLSAELSVTGDLTVLGPGAGELAISANDSSRVFNLGAGTTVRLVGLTLQDGSATGAGGAIYSAADELTIERCQIQDSAATTDGGGIYATGILNLLESTVADNTAAEGGGMALDGATAFIQQSTFSGNSAPTGTGGGLLIEGSSSAVTILQSTITDNDASTNGGGIRIAAGNVLMHNTIVADNSATTTNPDIYGTLLADSSYNLIGDGTGLTGISNNDSGNQIGTGASPIDPKLGPFKAHGGPTKTHSLRVDSPALDAGSDSGASFQLAIPSVGLLSVTHLGRTRTIEYDMLGRTAEVTQVDPDGIGIAAAPVTTYTYDAAGNLLSQTDPLDNTTSHTYDNLNRKTKTTDAEGGETEFTYDAAGRMTWLTDPEDNTTSWTFDPLGRVATETITVSSSDLTRTFHYDAAGNLTRRIDRNERVIDYSYDSLSRKTTEAWYDDVTDADAEQNVRKTYSTTYDEAGRVASVGDGSYDFEYTYSMFGRLTSTTQDLTGLSDDVVFTYAYDALGRKTQVSTEIGTTDDYVNTYAYDHVGRVTQITQSGVTGGNDVAEKRVDYSYSDDNTRATISRFADLAGTKSVAETDRVFDELGRVTDIVHERATTEFANYDLAWNAGSQLTAFDFTSLVGDDGDADYAYDDTSQLTDADYDFQTDESYTYDDNGNRTITGYTTGDHNRLTSDGTYNYAYDDEGNVTSKTNISTSESVHYTWDHRNRLTKVTFKNSSGTATKIVEYAYDHGQRWVRKTLDSNADSTIDESRIFVHDAGQIVLDFEKTGTGDASNSDLSHRYLWGLAVDQILADESVDDGTADDVAWTLTDHLNSVRDLVEYNPTTDTTSVIKHVTYDAFGNVTSDSASSMESLFLFTARPYDEDGELQNNLNRWYDLNTGRWMSEDPIGFDAADVNLYRYVRNSSLRALDFKGTASVWLTGEARRAVHRDPTDRGNVAWSFWRFAWTNRLQDYPYMVQRVQSHAEFSATLCHALGRGTATASIRVDESFIEVFEYNRNSQTQFTDQHRMRPEALALRLAEEMGTGAWNEAGDLYIGVSEVLRWTFQQDTTFEMYNGIYVPQPDSPKFYSTRYRKKGAFTFRPTGVPVDQQLTRNLENPPSLLDPGGRDDSMPQRFPPDRSSRAWRSKDKWQWTWSKGDRKPTVTYTTGYAPFSQ